LPHHPAICCSLRIFIALPRSIRRSLFLLTGNSRLLATRAAVEFICPIHRDPSPLVIRIIEFIHLVMVTTAGKSRSTEVVGSKVAKLSVTSEVASGRVTRSGRNLGNFVSAKASLTKNASGRNAGVFAHGKSAVAKTASPSPRHMDEDMSATTTNSPGEFMVPGKSPPVRRARNKAIAAVATDLNATSLAEGSNFNTDCNAATVAKVAVSENMSATGSKSPGDLVFPGKFPPDRTAKDQAITAVATDLNATGLALESSGNTIAATVGNVVVSNKVRTMLCYSVCYEFIHC
jgi:hypothetical protein